MQGACLCLRIKNVVVEYHNIIVCKLMSSGVEQFYVVFENFRLNVKNCIYCAVCIDDDVCIGWIVGLI